MPSRSLAVSLPTAVRTALLAALLLSPIAAAQHARTVPLDDPAYVLIERLQRRGHLLGLHPTALPYTEGEIARALEQAPTGAGRAGEWADLLRQRVDLAEPASDEIAVRADIGAEFDVATSGRLDPLRPVDGDPTIPVGPVNVFPHADAHVTLGTDRLVAQLGLRHDVYANDDPDGLDVVKRLMIRNQEGYVGVRTPSADLVLGRVATHWGVAGQDALAVSDNPYPYDALHLRIGSPRLAVRGLLGQLDSALPDGTFPDQDGQRPGDRPSAEPRIDRWLAAHRFDWRPVPQLALTVLETTLYSGANAGPSLTYLMPTQGFAFLVDNTPKNVENNGAVGAMLWGHHAGWTLHGEVFFDDLDILTGSEPASAALTGSLTRAGIVDDLDASFTLTAVTARNYNAGQPEGIYTYALRGLGVEYNDMVRARLAADWYPTRGLAVSPDVEALWQGEQTIDGPFPDNDEIGTILTGEVGRTLRLGVEARYQPVWWAWARADLGVNLGDGVPGGQGAGVEGLFTVGMRLATTGTMRADI